MDFFLVYEWKLAMVTGMVTIIDIFIIGRKTFQPWTFQPQASTPDLSTPNFTIVTFPAPDISIMTFSTPDFSTLDFSTPDLGLESSWLKSPGLKCPSTRYLNKILEDLESILLYLLFTEESCWSDSTFEDSSSSGRTLDFRKVANIFIFNEMFPLYSSSAED